MKNELQKEYWESIPIGKENAVTYDDLSEIWHLQERESRKILHKLSTYDNGDDYILIRSSRKGGGFYRTKNEEDIRAYRKECFNKGRSIFAPLRKIDRVLNIKNQIALFELYDHTENENG